MCVFERASLKQMDDDKAMEVQPCFEQISALHDC